MMSRSTFDECVEGAFLLVGAFSDRDLVEQLPRQQVRHAAVLLTRGVSQQAGNIGFTGTGWSLQNHVLVFDQITAYGGRAISSVFTALPGVALTLCVNLS